MTEVYPGRDGKVKAVKLRAGKSYREREIQHMHSLELSCDITAPAQEHTMNPEVQEFRPRKNASEIARGRINNLANDEREGPFSEQHLITND